MTRTSLSVIRIWQKNPEEKLGIVVKAHVDQNNQMELEIGAVGTREGPYLTIDIHEAGYRHRIKRNINRVCNDEQPDVRILNIRKLEYWRVRISNINV